MNAKNVRKWTAALRSGEYEQGRSRLRSKDDLYCCLGVACEVYRKETGQGVWDGQNDHDESRIFVVNDEAKYGELPNVVAHWLGLHKVIGGGTEMLLINMNDHSSRSFEQIADYLESKL